MRSVWHLTHNYQARKECRIAPSVTRGNTHQSKLAQKRHSWRKRTSTGYNWIPRAHKERLTMARGDLGKVSTLRELLQTRTTESVVKIRGRINAADGRARVTLKTAVENRRNITQERSLELRRRP